jgi:ABC-type sugar transport system ATPase subunit
VTAARSGEQNVVVGLRPEHFKEPEGSNNDLPSVEGGIVMFEDLGADAHVIVELDVEAVDAGSTGAGPEEAGEETVLLQSGRAFLNARVNPRTPSRHGTIRLSWDPDDLYVFDASTGASLRRTGAQ